MAAPNSDVEASCPGQEWVIRNLSALKERFELPRFVVDGVTRYVFFTPRTDHKIPGIYLNCVTKRFSTLRVHFALTIVHQQYPDESVLHEYDKLFEAKKMDWGWKTPITEPVHLGFILDNTLVLRTRVRFSKDTSPGSADAPLREQSHDLLARMCVEWFKGENSPEPDVTLRLGDIKLPAHRFLLAKSSDVFKAMFQSGMSESASDTVDIQEVAAEDMEIILKFIYGVLDALPEDRLQSLVLATDRLQVDQLMQRCVTQLIKRMALDNFAEIAVLADKVKDQHLHNACVKFALQKENRSALGKHTALKRAMAEAPDFAFKLLGDMLEQSVPKKARKA